MLSDGGWGVEPDSKAWLEAIAQAQRQSNDWTGKRVETITGNRAGPVAHRCFVAGFKASNMVQP